MRSPAVLAAALAIAFAAPALADHPRSEKPGAPVRLTLTTRHDASGTHVVLDAVVSRDVAALELSVAGATARFGATRAGQHRRLDTAIVVPTGGGVDVLGAARVGAGSQVRTGVASLRVGAPAPADKQRPFELRTLQGRSVAEVRE